MAAAMIRHNVELGLGSGAVIGAFCAAPSVHTLCLNRLNEELGSSASTETAILCLLPYACLASLTARNLDLR